MFDILVDDHVVCICVPGCVKAFVNKLTNSLGEEYKIQVRKHVDPDDKSEEDQRPEELISDLTDDNVTEDVIDSREKLESSNVVLEE